MNTYSQILTETKGTVAHITLNRPEKRNALGDQLVRELLSALHEADADNNIQVVVLRGAGTDFCAGADLAQLERLSQATVLDNLHDAAAASEMFSKPRKMKKLVIAAVRGRAFAGGAGLATACDLIIAARSAQFAYPEVKIGFVAAMVMAFLRRSLGEKRTLELLVTGKVISADEAERIGFVNRVCNDEDFDTEVDKFANEIAAISASAVMLTKQLLYQTDAMSFEQAIRAGVDMNAIARMTEDCQNGIKKFLSKS
ncbi:MAG TPA: enoyl-CoA hydratase/isomerase family protein [Blastocatellia bacterium]|nr:enoyl-CoA hydratase/isomerase family protein [Blastocatellia bacterium]